MNKQYRNTRLFRTETLAEELGLLAQQSQLIPKQVKFEDPDTDKNIVLDEKGCLKRATMLKIVEKLTSETYQYAATHLKVLFNTYRTYMTPKELMDMLLLRFNTKNQAVKLRVEVAFKTWVEHHPDDFDSEMVSKFRQMFRTIPKENNPFYAPAEHIMKMLDKPKVPPRQPPPAARGNFDFWGSKVEEIATGLTAIEFDLFNSVKSHEFLRVAWTKEDAHIKAPNIAHAIKHFNKIGEFVRTEILFGETPSLRATHIKQFVDLAMQLQANHNWNAFFAIIGTLESTPIARLKKTWAEVEKLKYMDTYNKCSALIQPTKNFAKYRERLRATLPPAVPYLGLILNDIFFLDEGNKDTIGDMCNFTKCFMIADQIEQFQRFQHKQTKPYDEFTSTLKKFLYDAPTLEIEQDAYEESLKIEPKRTGTSSARNSTSSATPMSPQEEEEADSVSDLGLQRVLDSQKKMNFVHEPMTLYLKLLGSHTPIKVVLPSSYTAKEALVNFSRKLTGVTPACSLVELPTNIILDDAPLLPYAKSKSQIPLVIFTDPRIVNVGVTLDKSLKQLKEMVLDLAAPLFSMLPILQAMFDLKDPFSFLYVEETRVARWLNMNKTLDEQGFKTDKGLLLLYPLKNMLKENAAYKADADVTGDLLIRKQDSTFATLKKGSKAKHYIALHDHFLLIFSSSDALVPKKVLSLEHFRVKYNERNHEILLTRTFNGFYHNGKKGASYILAVPPTNDEDDDTKKIKQWFDKIQINCGLIGAQAIFGVPLGNVSARRGPDNPIPLIIEQIIAFLLSVLSKEEEDCSKLFVTPGDPTLLDFYRQHFDQGLKVEFTKIGDNLVNTVGHLLMSYLIELPNPLLTYALYDQFVAYGSRSDDREELKRLLSLLPEPNRVVLCCILEFLHRIANRAEELGNVFGPIFIRPQPPPNVSVSAPTTPSFMSPTAAIIAAEAQTSSSPPTPTSFIPPLPLSASTTMLVQPPQHDPAVSVVVTRLIQNYNPILSHSKEGILVRRLIVKTRNKINTISVGTANSEFGTIRSVKSEVVEMASDFQKKRQKTLQNVENKKHEIEEMFKGKGGKSSISLRHSGNGYSARSVLDTSSSSMSSNVSDGEDEREGSNLRLSDSSFGGSTRSKKNSSSFLDSYSASSHHSTNSTSAKEPPKRPYLVKSTSNASKEPEANVSDQKNKERMLSELQQLHINPANNQLKSPGGTSIESKRLHRKYGMSKLVCSHCRNAIVSYDQPTCTHCGFE